MFVNMANILNADQEKPRSECLLKHFRSVPLFKVRMVVGLTLGRFFVYHGFGFQGDKTALHAVFFE